MPFSDKISAMNKAAFPNLDFFHQTKQLEKTNILFIAKQLRKI